MATWLNLVARVCLDLGQIIDNGPLSLWTQRDSESQISTLDDSEMSLVNGCLREILAVEVWKGENLLSPWLRLVSLGFGRTGHDTEHDSLGCQSKNISSGTYINLRYILSTYCQGIVIFVLAVTRRGWLKMEKARVASEITINLYLQTQLNSDRKN